jgi:malonate decarboxylase gamma subunit
MTLDDILKSLFPTGHEVMVSKEGLITGTGKLRDGRAISVLGLGDGQSMGTAAALPLAAQVLDVIKTGGDTPILVLVDLLGQLMARRDEMIGLNEYLAHLAKCLLLASQLGHRTVGLEYGKASAGGFLATALATEIFVALPGAEPAVMDLPSMARVTKLPEEKLKELAKSTPVFSPGLDSMLQMGALAEVWDANKPLDEQLEATLKKASAKDVRDQLGAERKGRPMAALVTKRVIAAAMGTRDDLATA